MCKKIIVPSLIFSIIESIIICYGINHISSSIFFLILSLIPILILWGYVNNKWNEKKSFRNFIWISSILLSILFIFVGLVLNEKIHKCEIKEELERSQIYYKEKRREEFIADSLQKVQDSLYILKQSNILAQRDGKKIMGSFFWGMSHKDYKSVYYRIEKETNGIITVNGIDFKLGHPTFYKNQLCGFTIKTVRKYKLYDYDINVFDKEDYEYNKYIQDKSTIYDYLLKRYVKSFGNESTIHIAAWPFLYKAINFYKADYESERQGAGTLITFHLAIDISHPQLIELLENEKDSIRKQIEKERTENIERERQKKAKFSDGL